MKAERVYQIPISDIYPLYIQKVEKKGRSQEELSEVIRWLTGYDQQGLDAQIDKKNGLRAFFDEAPHIHDNANLITGSVCGVRVEEIEDPVMKNVRRMDKLVDELAKGRKMEKILRS